MTAQGRTATVGEQAARGHKRSAADTDGAPPCSVAGHAVLTTGAVGIKVLLQPRRAGAPCGDKSPTRGPGQAGYRCPFKEHAYGQGRVERQGKGICQLQLRIWLPVPVQCVADLRPL